MKLTKERETQLVGVLKELMLESSDYYGYTLYEACLEEQNCDAIFMDIFNNTFNDFEDNYNLSSYERIKITDKVVKSVLDGGQDA